MSSFRLKFSPFARRLKRRILVGVRKLGIEIPAVLDEFGNSTEQSYTGWPDRIYLIDATGRVGYKSKPGPFGFKSGELAMRLRESWQLRLTDNVMEAVWLRLAQHRLEAALGCLASVFRSGYLYLLGHFNFEQSILEEAGSSLPQPFQQGLWTRPMLLRDARDPSKNNSMLCEVNQ
jgi:hypothetical protein